MTPSDILASKVKEKVTVRISPFHSEEIAISLSEKDRYCFAQTKGRNLALFIELDIRPSQILDSSLLCSVRRTAAIVHQWD